MCGICHMPLDGCAPGAAGPGDDSPVVWGKVRAGGHRRCNSHSAVVEGLCRARGPLTPLVPLASTLRPEIFVPRAPQCSHYFHLMCITTWLHNKNTCPICRRKWEFQTGPKPAPATPGVRRQGEGFAAAAAAAPPPQPPEVIEAD